MAVPRFALIVWWVAVASCANGYRADAGTDASAGVDSGQSPIDAGSVLPRFTSCAAPAGHECIEATITQQPCEDGGRACFLRALWDESRCPAGASCRLTILFAGGEAGCPTPISQPGYGRTGLFWAKNDYVFVCAQPFLSAAETDRQPYYDELPRVRAVINIALAMPELRSRVDPKRVSLQGISHGGFNVALNYIAGGDEGSPAHIVVYDGSGDIGRIEATLWASFQATNEPGHRTLHERFVSRENMTDTVPRAHPSRGLPFCAGVDSTTDERYRRDSTDWHCTSDSNYFGTRWGCSDIRTRAAWRFFGCDTNGRLGALDIPDHEVECTAQSIASCPGRQATYVDFPPTGLLGLACTHETCVTWACAAAAACEWISGAPCRQ